MGSINAEAATIFGTLSDFVGVKSGLALNERALLTLLSRDEYGRFNDYLSLPQGAWIRIESVVYEEMAEFLLFSVGRLERINNLVPFATVYHKYKHDKAERDLFEAISQSCIDFFNGVLADPELPNGHAIDPTPFVRACRQRFGPRGLRIALDILTAITIQQEISSAYSPTGSDWDDVADLEDLFRSEGLDTQYGRFVDQRYIDYLHRNFQDIDRINWRKFEGITGEYFDRQGFNVENRIGPKRRRHRRPRLAVSRHTGESASHHRPVQAPEGSRFQSHRQVSLCGRSACGRRVWLDRHHLAIGSRRKNCLEGTGLSDPRSGPPNRPSVGVRNA